MLLMYHQTVLVPCFLIRPVPKREDLFPRGNRAFTIYSFKPNDVFVTVSHHHSSSKENRQPRYIPPEHRSVAGCVGRFW